MSRLSLKDQVATFRIWASFAKAQLPLEHAAESCAEQFEKNSAQWLRVMEKISTGTRISDAVGEEGLWPDISIKVIEAGEISNSLGLVFDELVSVAEDQIEANKEIKGLIPSIIYVIVGIHMLFSFIVYIYPSMTAIDVGKGRNGLVAVMDSISEMAASVFPVFLTLEAVAFIGALILLQDERVRMSLTEQLDRIPFWGKGSHYLALSVWARLFSIIESTGSMHDIDSIRIASSAIPERFQRPFNTLVKDYESTGSLGIAANRKKWGMLDPRKVWPVVFSSALSSGVSSGTLQSTMAHVAPGLQSEGKAALKIGAKIANGVGMGVAGLCLGLMMTMLVMSSLAMTMTVL